MSHRCLAVFRLAVLALTVALTGSACTATVSGHGTAGLAPPPSSGTSASGSPSRPATSSARPPGSGVLSAAQLDRLLEPAPAGSRDWGNSWSRNRHPSLAQFTRRVYRAPFAQTAAQLLRAQHLRIITHRTWYAPDVDQADMVLLEFASPTGARSRYLVATAAKRYAPGELAFRVPGRPAAVGYYRNQLDALGNVAAILYGQVRNIVVEEFYYSPAVLKKADAITWMRRQLRLLG